MRAQPRYYKNTLRSFDARVSDEERARMTMDVASFGALLRQYRLAAGLSQEALAARSGLSARAVSALERGVSRKPYLTTVGLLADGLGLTPDQRQALIAAARPRTDATPAPAAAAEAPAAAHTAPGDYPGPVATGPFVGREAELARALAVLDQVPGGGGRLLLIAGEPGVGKTRLAQEILLRATVRGYRALVGRCYEEQTSLPFVEILTAAFGIASPALRQEAPRRFPALSPVVPDVPASTSPYDAGDARPRMLHAAAGFLGALAAEAPLALLLDDLQWADSASLDLLLYLVRQLRGQPVLLVGTYRDVEVQQRHPLGVVLASLLRERLVEEVTLRGLPPSGTEAMISARLGLRDVAPQVVRLVHARTEGNPFFIEEVLTALVEQGAGSGGALLPGGDGELAVPRSIRAIVIQRVGRLAPEGRDLLWVASVLGQEWDLDLLLAAAAQPEEVALDQLEVALSMRLLEERRTGRHDRYAFAHVLIQQAIYAEIPRFRLRRLHLRAGEALERLCGGQPECAADLTRHFLAAGDDRRAARAAVEAGAHAARLFATAEALQYYETALECLERLGDEIEAAGARCARGRLLDSVNRSEEAFADFAAALRAYERAGDAAGQALVHLDMHRAYMFRLELATATAHVERALALWPAGREDADLARILLHAAFCATASGDTARAAPLLERGLALARQIGDPVLLDWAKFLTESDDTAGLALAGGAQPG